MTSKSYQNFESFMISFLAQELLDNKAFDYDEEAFKVASKVINTLLPDKEKTRAHSLFEVFDDGHLKVGDLWYFISSDEQPIMHLAFIYINENQRRKGYAKQCLQIVERDAIKHNCELVSLGVFVNNVAAIKLYESFGYQRGEKIDLIGYGKPVRYRMSKDLGC